MKCNIAGTFVDRSKILYKYLWQHMSESLVSHWKFFVPFFSISFLFKSLISHLVHYITLFSFVIWQHESSIFRLMRTLNLRHSRLPVYVCVNAHWEHFTAHPPPKITFLDIRNSWISLQILPRENNRAKNVIRSFLAPPRFHSFSGILVTPTLLGSKWTIISVFRCKGQVFTYASGAKLQYAYVYLPKLRWIAWSLHMLLHRWKNTKKKQWLLMEKFLRITRDSWVRIIRGHSVTRLLRKMVFIMQFRMVKKGERAAVGRGNVLRYRNRELVYYWRLLLRIESKIPVIRQYLGEIMI